MKINHSSSLSLYFEREEKGREGKGKGLRCERALGPRAGPHFLLLWGKVHLFPDFSEVRVGPPHDVGGAVVEPDDGSGGTAAGGRDTCNRGERRNSRRV